MTRLEKVITDVDSCVKKGDFQALEKSVFHTIESLSTLGKKIENEYYTQDSVNGLLAKARKFNETNFVFKEEYDKKIKEIFAQFSVMNK